MKTRRNFSLQDFAPKATKDAKPVQVVQNEKVVRPQTVSTTAETIIVDPSGSVDLNRIDRHVTALFQDMEERQRQQMSSLVALMCAEHATVEEYVMAESYRMRLDADIDVLEKQLKFFPEYVEKSKPLLEKYRELMPNGTRRTLGDEHSVVDAQDHQMFQDVVFEFIRIASQFSPHIKVVSNNIAVQNCSCGGIPYIVDSTSICPQCSKETKLREGTLTFAKGARSDPGRGETFGEYFDEAQGRRKKPIPPSVYQAIETHRKTYSIQGQLTKSDILRILKKNKMSDYYKSINLIMHVLNGTPLPDIQKYRQRCLERHALIEQEYTEIRREEGRNNFLYAWFVLKVCLFLEGYPIREDEFISLTTRDATIEHNRIMINICNRIRERQKTDATIIGNWDFKGFH